MEGVIVNYRQGKTTQKNNHMVIMVNGVDKRDKAMALVSKKVIWTNTKGNSISGTIAAAHGNKGAVRAIFERGMPGQAVGNKVKID